MANRIFVSAVIVLWLTSMTWLVSERILPSFFGGQPPVVELYDVGKIVAWRVQWEGKEIGRAASVRIPGVSGTTDLRNRVILENVPLMELAPSWMRMTVGKIGNITFDALTRIEFDSLGNFSAFDSRINLDDAPAVLKMSGRIKDSYLRLKVTAGTLSYTTPIYLPNSKALSEALFPEARIPHLHVGRRWPEEVYSPFHSPGDPVELVQAEVVSMEWIEREDGRHRVLRVEYRGMIGSGIPQQARLRAVSWVEPTGKVLRRDVYIGSSMLRFNRLSDEASAEIGAELFEQILKAEKHLNLLPAEGKKSSIRPARAG